jgi:hypothetical protein
MAEKQLLMEYQNQNPIATELTEAIDPLTGAKKKDLYMKGIFIQGDILNQNQRIYPVSEIRKAVDSLNALIENNISIFGEADHPNDLKINLDRVSHVITQMWMEGSDGYGKLKVLPTPMGNIIKAILESGCKLGVSSRGSGNVNESNGRVDSFEIITVDCVCQPSAPNAFPIPIYEGIRNYKRNGDSLLEMAAEVNSDTKVQKYLQNEIIRFIKDLKL